MPQAEERCWAGAKALAKSDVGLILPENLRLPIDPVPMQLVDHAGFDRRVLFFRLAASVGWSARSDVAAGVGADGVG